MLDSRLEKQGNFTEIGPAKICLVCGFLIAVFLPLLFNPFSTQTVEAAKGAFFEGLVLIMLAGLVIMRLKTGDFRRRQAGDFRRHQAGDSSGFARIRRVFWVERPYLLPALTYLAACSIAAVLSSDSGRSFWGAETRQGMLFIASLIVFSLIIAETIRSLEQAEWLVSGILIGSVPVALYGCIQYFGLDPLKWQTSSLSPVHSTTGYSLYLGAYLAMVIPFSLRRLFADPENQGLKGNLIYLIILALQVACLIFTLSRGAFVALVAGCGVFSAFAIPRRQRKLFTVTFLSLLVLGGIFLMALTYGWKITPLSKQANVLRSDIGLTRQVSNSDRLTVWRRTLPIIAGSPLVGYGPDRYAATYERYYPDSEAGQNQNTTNWDPHNLFLTQMTSAGVLGLMAFSWIILTFYRVVNQRFQNTGQRETRLLAAALMASAAAYLVQAMFNPSGMVATVIFWLVLGIGCAKF